MHLEKYIAKTFFGLEEILEKEIKDCGGVNTQILNRAVSFEGDLHCLYSINLKSRTALRIIKPILSFRAHNETVFYKRVRSSVATDAFVWPANSFATSGSVNSRKSMSICRPGNERDHLNLHPFPTASTGICGRGRRPTWTTSRNGHTSTFATGGNTQEVP